MLDRVTGQGRFASRHVSSGCEWLVPQSGVLLAYCCVRSTHGVELLPLQAEAISRAVIPTLLTKQLWSVRSGGDVSVIRRAQKCGERPLWRVTP